MIQVRLKIINYNIVTSIVICWHISCVSIFKKTGGINYEEKYSEFDIGSYLCDTCLQLYSDSCFLSVQQRYENGNGYEGNDDE